MNDFLDNIPENLFYLWVKVNMANPKSTVYLSAEEYKTIEENLDFFPAYKKWKEIPKEIHEKYEQELKGLREKYFPTKQSDMVSGEGIWSYIRRQEPSILTKESFSKTIKCIEDIGKFERESNELWNRHYSKFMGKHGR